MSSNKPLIWITMGGQDRTNPVTATLNRHLLELGWGSFLGEYAYPYADAGWDIVLHNPFGKPVGPKMHLDQIQRLEKLRIAGSWANHRKLSKVLDIDAFRDAVSRLTETGTEVVAYFGNPFHWEQLSPVAWQRRALDSIIPALDCGCSIGFDSGRRALIGSQYSAFIQQQMAAGVETYVEGWANVDNPALWQCGYISHESNWQNQYFPKPPVDRWPTNIIRQIDKKSMGDDVSRENCLAIAAEIIADGHRPSIAGWRTREWNITIDDINELRKG